MIEHLLGLSLDREARRRFLAYMDQVSFATEFVLSSGPEKAVRGVDVCPGSVLRFTTLPGRGTDVSDMAHRGIPIHYASATAIANAAHYVEPGYGMMRSFSRGPLATCGISNAGWPSQDEGRSFGLHGGISNTEAVHIAIDARWTDDDYRV